MPGAQLHHATGHDHLIGLNNHTAGLLKDLGLFSEQDAVRAIEHFDDEPRAPHSGLKRVNLAGLHATRRNLKLCYDAKILMACATGLVVGWVVLRALRAENSRPR